MNILKNLDKVKNNLNLKTKLVVVTKKCSIREINQSIFLGVTDIGENKIKEAKEKKEQITYPVKWHMIGHLQSNKVKEAVKIFDMIQSVDSLKLAIKIDHKCKSLNKTIAVLIQVNIGKEPQKHGIKPEEIIFFLKEISNLKNIKVLGLMAMTPFIEAEKARPYFKEMKNLFNKVKKEKIQNIEMKYLSMGMTNDYEVAIEEGANMVRIGTAIFK